MTGSPFHTVSDIESVRLRTDGRLGPAPSPSREWMAPSPSLLGPFMLQTLLLEQFTSSLPCPAIADHGRVTSNHPLSLGMRLGAILAWDGCQLRPASATRASLHLIALRRSHSQYPTHNKSTGWPLPHGLGVPAVPSTTATLEILAATAELAGSRPRCCSRRTTDAQ